MRNCDAEMRQASLEVKLALSSDSCYRDAVSLNEILEAIPKLSFGERQQLVRRAIEADDDLTLHEEAALEQRLKNFRADPRDGVSAESLKGVVRERREPR